MGLEVTGCRTTCGARVGVSGTTSGNKGEESEPSKGMKPHPSPPGPVQ